MSSSSCKMSLLCLLFLATISLSSGATSGSQLVDERESLLMFKSGVSSDPDNVLENWSHSSHVHVCNWTGIKCNNACTEIVQLDLSGRSLRGSISPSLANVSSLMILDLSWNSFESRIPPELGYLYKLEQLDLSWNFLEGTIPVEFGYLHRLAYLNLGSNRLSGSIPGPLFCNGTSSLDYLDLSNNSLSGVIPLNDQCGLPYLRFFLVWSNQLEGRVPFSLSNSSRLEWLDLENNFLTGELPSETVSKLTNLQSLYLSYNNFVCHEGNTNLEPFLSALANLSNLEELELAGNNLSAAIPPAIGDLSAKIVQIHMDDNFLYGSIPPHISNLVNLTLLNLSSNLLNGSIPPELCRMGRLERVYLSNNSLTGEIPAALGDITHLGLLDLSKNKLSGRIPDSFSNLPQLRRLLLYDNELSGNIPPSLGECINLEILDLSRNRISGTIPSEVAGLSSLKLYLNLSGNHLEGPLPLELSKMDMVLAIDLSSNNLLGSIPSQLGSCIALEYLNLSDNSLDGPLPSSIGSLASLKQLDVSFNRLSGEIPESLEASLTLRLMNFSFNKFSGNISNKGAFSTMTMDSLLGNNGLCGDIEGLPRCRQKHGHRPFLVPMLVALTVTPVLFALAYTFLCRSKFTRQSAVSNSSNLNYDEEKEVVKEMKYPKISYRQLNEATGGFSPSSLIGSGQFGQVYKGILQDSTIIAVKVLDTRKAGEHSESSFKRECQVLKRARHRNLIRIITICSKPDFKALVFPLMSNGSLESHLYPGQGRKGLDLFQLISICSDVAEGVAYLHNYSPVTVVHCDLKPSNILLDDDMTALVTDFGISRLVRPADDHQSGDSASFSSTHGLLCGSVGYIAPEYGMGRRASTQGDVYSFGVLLLEMVTGRRPTDVLFHDGSSLHEWVKSHFPHRLDPIVEQAMVRCTPSKLQQTSCYKQIWREVFLELVELGLMCTQYNPFTRPTMLDMSLEMGKLKQYLACPPSMPTEETLPKASACIGVPGIAAELIN